VSRITASERLQRLLALIPWVAANDGPTVREVCERFDLKERELLADISLVSLVGVPPYTPDELFDVVVEDGRVWVHLSPTFRRSLRLTPEQALALVAAGRSLRAVPGADPEGPLARGLAKLAATLGVDPDEAGFAPVEHGLDLVLSTVRDASAAHRRVRLDYYSHGRDERTAREVDPHRVYADRGQWYLVGFDHLRGEERLFRVDRIDDVDVLDEEFEPPAEPRAHGLYEPDPSDRRVCLELAPDAAWVAEAYPVETLEPVGDGRLRVTLAISALPWLERLLVRLGPNATVAGPADDDIARLRADTARRMLGRYSGAVPSAAP